MSRIDDFIKYTVSGYRYAPESFQAYKVILDQSGRGNHTYILLELSPEQRWEIGNACIAQSKEAARVLAKRYDRKQEKKIRQYMTYGFMDANNPHTCHFTQQLRCRPDAPLSEKFRIYKEFKDYLLDLDCQIEQFTECKLDGYFRPTDVKKVCATVDITRPVIVWLNVA